MPVGLAKIFRNCGYLEYPALGRFPDEPENGYVSSGADLGDLCCPCWFPRKEGEAEKGEPGEPMAAGESDTPKGEEYVSKQFDEVEQSA